jgi:hypothetical protein
MWTLFTAYLKREPRLPFFMAYSNPSKAAAGLVLDAYLTRFYRPAKSLDIACRLLEPIRLFSLSVRIRDAYWPRSLTGNRAERSTSDLFIGTELSELHYRNCAQAL